MCTHGDLPIKENGKIDLLFGTGLKRSLADSSWAALFPKRINLLASYVSSREKDRERVRRMDGVGGHAAELGMSDRGWSNIVNIMPHIDAAV